MDGGDISMEGELLSANAIIRDSLLKIVTFEGKLVEVL